MIDYVGDKDSRYYIDDLGFIVLTSRRGEVKCDHCQNIIGNIGDDTILIRTSITVLDTRENALLMRCGKCRKFTRVKADLPEQTSKK